MWRTGHLTIQGREMNTTPALVNETEIRVLIEYWQAKEVGWSDEEPAAKLAAEQAIVYWHHIQNKLEGTRDDR